MNLPHELFWKSIENRITSQKLSLFFMLETKDGNYFGSGTNHWFTKFECTPSPWVLGLVKLQGNAGFRRRLVQLTLHYRILQAGLKPAFVRVKHTQFLRCISPSLWNNYLFTFFGERNRGISRCLFSPYVPSLSLLHRDLLSCFWLFLKAHAYTQFFLEVRI